MSIDSPMRPPTAPMPPSPTSLARAARDGVTALADSDLAQGVKRAFVGETLTPVTVGLEGDSSPRLAATSLEMVMAQAALDLEDSADRSRSLRRQERSLASQAKRLGISEKRRAARWEAVAGAVAASGKMATSATGNANYQAGGEGLSKLMGIPAGDAKARGETMDVVASEAGARAEDLGSSADRAERSAGKILDRAQSVSEQRHQVRMSILRG